MNALVRALASPRTVLEKPDGRRTIAHLLQARVVELSKIERDTANQSYLDRLQRGASWLWKAYEIADERDLEARFIFGWVAFNALYGVRRDWLERVQPRRRSRVTGSPIPGITDLQWFLRRMVRLDDEARIIDLLRDHRDDVKVIVEDLFLQEAYWKWDIDTAERRRHDDYTKIVEAPRRDRLYESLHILFLWRLRTLRNLLIHGASTNVYSKRREADEKSFAAATRLTERAVGCFIAIMEESTAQKWPPTEGPRRDSPWHGPLRETPQVVADEWGVFIRLTANRNGR